MAQIKTVEMSNINSIMAEVRNGEFVRIRFANAYLESAFKTMAVRSERQVIVVNDKTTKDAWVAFAI